MLPRLVCVVTRKRGVGCQGTNGSLPHAHRRAIYDRSPRPRTGLGNPARLLGYYEWVTAAKHLRLVALLLIVPLLGNRLASAYSLLTHEQLIDLTWNDSIVPLLLSRYPTLTADELEHARAYAYGGCVIQDIGYYPFGDRTFSNLTHYVRSGDFVVNLFRNATNVNELAFAVGALSHYIGDTEGHSLATNRAVPIEFPKLEAKFGSVVNYAQGKVQHVQTEFAFDINEVAHRRMAPLRYQRHIGLAVPLRQLALAYYQTYGLTKDFTGTRGQRLNTRAYRFAVRSFIPAIAYAVRVLHKKVEPPDPTTPEIVELRKEIAAVAQANEWNRYRQRKVNLVTYPLAGLLFILPKVGSLKMVSVKGPTVATEAEYVHSVSVSVAALRRRLARFTPPGGPRTPGGPATPAAPPPPSPSAPPPADPAPPQEARRGSRDPRHPLRNRDLDTGNLVKPGGYPLTDSTYADLLHMLTQQPNQPIPPGIKEDVLAYYEDLDLPITTKKDSDRWKVVLADLETLRGMPTNPEPKPFPTYGEDEQDDE